tara:strand:- start:80 stop:1123 length:1044 start_codon:yes stop_codon:yes gene_type:complete
MLDVNEIDFINLSEVNNEKLLKFYSIAYPNRYKIIHKNWRWLYRTSLSGLEPIVALYKKEIIGHAGLISTNLLYERKILKAIWFVDFYILSKYRNMGLGKILTKKWMELESCHLTFCNQNSLRVFKKLGWVENDNFYKSCKLINPLKWIPLIRSIDNKFLNKLNILKFFNNKNIIKKIRLYKITENQKILSDIFFSKNKTNKNLDLEIIRDYDWIDWRIFESPFKKNYYFVSIENSFIILSILRNDNKKKLNIIFTNYETEQDKILLNKYIITWSIENNVDIVWLQLDNIDSKTINNFYPKKFKLNFACNSNNISINKNILKDLPNISGLDSDIDVRNYEDKNFDFE